MKKIKIAVVGLRFGRVIVEQLLRKPADRFFDLAGICDLDPQILSEVAAMYHVPVIADLDAVLDDDNIGAVALMTPPWGRAELIHRIIRCNQHVMTTKPFELDLEKARNVLEEAEKSGMAVYLNSPGPDVSKDLVQIEKWRNQFNLGKAVGARADIWAKKFERPGATWYKDPSRCPVAPIFRIGIYLINHLVLLFGEAESVQVLQSRMAEGVTMPDNAQLGIRFKSGALCNVFVSFDVRDGMDHRQAFTVNFEQGTLYSNVGPGNLKDPDRTLHLSLVTPGKKPKAPPHVAEKLIRGVDESYPWESFYNAIQGKHAPQPGYHAKILMGLNIIEAMARAEKSGRTEGVKAV
jgi:predicted dehydrogenase